MNYNQIWITDCQDILIRGTRTDEENFEQV